MTLWKMVETHQILFGKLTWENLSTIRRISPLMTTFVRDGSVYFALYAYLHESLAAIFLMASITEIQSVSAGNLLGIFSTFVVKGPASSTFYPYVTLCSGSLYL
jgi:hypothetical protein